MKYVGFCVGVATVLLSMPAQSQQPNRLQQGAGAGAERREMIERRLRERVGAVVRERLQLSDEQWTKVTATNRKFEESRRLLVQQERDIRLGLRDEMLSGEKANQDRVSGLLDRWQKVQRQRLELLEQEQKELGTYLTPVQRAKFLVLQEQMRRRVEEMRRDMIEKQQPPRGGARRPLPR